MSENHFPIDHRIVNSSIILAQHVPKNSDVCSPMRQQFLVFAPAEDPPHELTIP
jgi:hypothetical protein